DAAGGPGPLQGLTVRAGLGTAGWRELLVRHGLLVAGLSIGGPAALAIGISFRAAQASNGPIMATTAESATNLRTFETPAPAFGSPSLASSEVARSTPKPSSVGLLLARNGMPRMAGIAARALLSVSGMSTT